MKIFRWPLLLVALVTLAAAPLPAAAHGVQGRARTPIPIEAFVYAGGVVLLISFAGLGLGWSRPLLTRIPWRPAPSWISRLVLGAGTIWLARVLVLLGAFSLFAAAALGSTKLNDNIAPVAVFVTWWIGLVPLSACFGNVWREINPWVTLARLGRFPDRGRDLPHRFGVWPAVVLLVAFGWFELVYPTASEPRLIAALMLGYTALTLTGMRVFGMGTWLDRGEVFSVFCSVVARLSSVDVRGDGVHRQLGFRPPVIGVTGLPREVSYAALVIVMIGLTTFDGLSGTDLWAKRDAAATQNLAGLGVDAFPAAIVSGTIGLFVTLAVLGWCYERVCRVSGSVGGWDRTRSGLDTGATFAHALVPIALAYAVAHYVTLFAFQSQDLIRLASDPLGTGADWLGTADRAIDFRVLSANAIWAVQVTAIVIGHVLGLLLAHDRALTLGVGHRHAVRSQYAVLGLMVALTVGGLWSLSAGMAKV